MRLKLFVVLGAILFLQCSNDPATSAVILEREKMESVLWDIIQADVYTNQIIKADSSKNAVDENIKLQKQIFSIHNISKESFYKSYKYYLQRPDEMRIILDSIYAHQQKAEKFKYIKPALKVY